MNAEEKAINKLSKQELVKILGSMTDKITSKSKKRILGNRVSVYFNGPEYVKFLEHMEIKGIKGRKMSLFIKNRLDDIIK